MMNPVNILFFFGFERVNFVGKLELYFAKFFHHGFLLSFCFLNKFLVLVAVVVFVLLEFLSKNNLNLMCSVSVCLVIWVGLVLLVDTLVSNLI